MASKNDIRRIQEASNLLKIIGNPQRLAILCCLREEKEMSVGEITDFLGLTQSAVSQHLAKLRDRDLVVARRDQQTMYYSLSSNEVTEIIKVLRKLYCPS